jgi:hypothetical protein
MSINAEMELVTKLVALGFPAKSVWDGLTTQDERRDKVRAYCQQVPEVIYRIENGRHILIKDAFRRAYSEDL